LSALFPLPLTPFEHYLWTDDRPAYPMCFVVRMSFDGEMSRDAFEAALDETILRHPLVECVVDRSLRSWPVWTTRPGLRPDVNWGRLDEPLSFPHGVPIDLTCESGLRFWVRGGEGRTELTIQAHHSMTDGLGILRLLGDLLGAYSRRAGDDLPGPKLRPIDVTKLSRRGEVVFQPPEPISRGEVLRASIREAARWFLRRPTQLAAPRVAMNMAGSATATFPKLHVLIVDRVQTKRLLSVTRRHGVTLNDLVLRDMFLAIHDWNRQVSPARPGRWLRINMPVDLRSRIHQAIPAANTLSYAFLTRHIKDCRDPSRLLDGIRWETEMIKRWNLGLHFLGGLAVGRKLPGLVRLCTSSSLCFATVVQSFVGEISRRFGVRFPTQEGRLVMGNLVLRKIIAAPPIRPKTRAAFVVHVYNGELRVSGQYDPRYFRDEDGEQFLTVLADRLRQSAAEAEAAV